MEYEPFTREFGIKWKIFWSGSVVLVVFLLGTVVAFADTMTITPSSESYTGSNDPIINASFSAGNNGLCFNSAGNHNGYTGFGFGSMNDNFSVAYEGSNAAVFNGNIHGTITCLGVKGSSCTYSLNCAGSGATLASCLASDCYAAGPQLTVTYQMCSGSCGGGGGGGGGATMPSTTPPTLSTIPNPGGTLFSVVMGGWAVGIAEVTVIFGAVIAFAYGIGKLFRIV